MTKPEVMPAQSGRLTGRIRDSSHVNTVNKLLRSDISRSDAIKELTLSQTEGFLWAAEIALDNAMNERERGMEQITDDIRLAIDYYSKVKELRPLALEDHVGGMDDKVARAKFQLGHMGVTTSLIRGHLPQRPAASKAYLSTLRVGLALGKAYQVPVSERSDRSKIGISTALNLFGVNALLERLGLKIGSADWWTFLSGYMQSPTTNNTLSDGEGHDIAVYTTLPEADKPQLAHRSVVRKAARSTDRADGLVTNGVSRIVMADLMLRGDEGKQLGAEIIRECHEELTNIARPDPKLITRIDERTNRAVDILEAA